MNRRSTWGSASRANPLAQPGPGQPRGRELRRQPRYRAKTDGPHCVRVHDANGESSTGQNY